MFRKIEDIILSNQVNLKEMRAPEKCKLRAASFGARSLLQQASELGACCSKLRTSPKLGACCSKLGAQSLRCSKLRSLELVAASSELRACVAASFGARSLVAISSELKACLLRARSLLRAQSLLQQAPDLSGAWQAPKLSGARSLLHERNASSGKAPKLRSLLQQAPSSKLHGTKKKQHKEKCLLGSCVGPAAVAPSSKLVPNSKLAPAPSRLQAPSSLPLNVSGARSSGDGVRGRGW